MPVSRYLFLSLLKWAAPDVKEPSETDRTVILSSRRVKCDEGQPGCQRCLKAGYSCSGYAVAAPSRDSVLHVVIDIAPKYELKTRNSSLFCDIQDPGHTVDVESPEWELMESFRYCKCAAMSSEITDFRHRVVLATNIVAKNSLFCHRTKSGVGAGYSHLPKLPYSQHRQPP